MTILVAESPQKGKSEVGILRRFFKKEPDYDVVIEGPKTFQLEVVGESHYQEALSDICQNVPAGGKKVRAILVLEEENPYDKYAVRVDIEGKTIGYLNRKNAREFRLELVSSVGQLARRSMCRAIIHGGDEGKSYGVWLDLPII